jgi:hypothetical protein
VNSLVSQRASVGSTEASDGRLARVGVVGPTRASVDSTAPNPQEERENQQTIDCRVRLVPGEVEQTRNNTRR